MKPKLSYYFSTGSRYSYLSMSQVPGLEKRLGVEFDWVPVNGKRMRSLRGVDPFQGPPQSGQYDWTYRERDAKAWAAYYGITFQEPQDVEFDVELLLRAVIAAGEMGVIRDYAWALASEVFAAGSWPLDDDVVERVAAAQGLDVDMFNSRRMEPRIQTQLENNCVEAVERGAFGTPSWFVDEELYWGNDRLVLLEHRLTQARESTAQHSTLPIPVGLDHVVLSSANPQMLVDFYTHLFSAQVERTVGDFLWQIRIGDSLLDIMRAEQPTQGQNMDHFCIRIVQFRQEQLLEQLNALGIEAQATGKIYGAQGFGPSIYFVDPDGNRVELKQHKQH